MPELAVEPAVLTDEQERWAASVANDLASRGLSEEGRPPNRDWILEGTRWACVWIEDCRAALDSLVPGSRMSKNDLKTLVDRAFHSSLAKCPWVTRYPTGAMTLTATMAAIEAFCLTQGGDAEEIRGWLTEKTEVA